MTAARVGLSGAPLGRLAVLAARLAALRGRRRYGLAFLLGILATAALPPVYLTPLLLPAFTGLLWLQDGSETRRAAFALGWWFGFGFFVSGFYWIGISMLVDPLHFAWMIPFAVGGLSAGFALLTGLVLVALQLVALGGLGRVLALAVAWSVAEWLRGHLLTGFPWNLIGYAWTVADAPMQFAALAGSYALGTLTVLIAALPACLAGPGAARRPLLPLGLAAALLALLWGGGAWRLAQAADAMVPGVTLRLVQANIEEHLKWNPDRLRANLDSQLRLSASPGAERVTDIVWPETAVPYLLDEEPQLRARLAQIVPKGGLLVTGTLRREPAPGGRGPDGGPFLFHNSLEALDDRGVVVAHYDKFHLVPFGEYVPFRGILPIAKLTPGRGDFSPGPGPRTVSLDHLPPVSPLICYEAIFPGEVADPANPPSWLLNVTNDAWFGDSSGPYQHFESARMRAVEQGVPLVRAANTGISGVTDAYGRVIARLGLGEAGVLDAPLPVALPGGTPFAHHGELGYLLLLLLLAGLARPLSRIA
jgi:apolipoprotein N-acyltransferase